MQDDDVEVRSSNIHDRGLFARRTFAPGEIVLRWDTSQIVPTSDLSSLPDELRRYTHPLDEQHSIIVQPPERFVNHSCNNNTEVRSFCDVAIRSIAVGDEITSDYGSDGSGVSFDCACQSVNCRKRIGATSPRQT